MVKKLVAIAGMALLLTGCSAPSNSEIAHNACVDAAEEQVGATIDASGVETMSLDDALFAVSETGDRKVGDDNDMFTSTGKFTYEKDGTESRRGMLCTVTFENGKAGDADLSITG